MPDRIVEVLAGANAFPVIGILKPQGTVAVVSLQMLIVCPCQRLAAIRERVAGSVVGDSLPVECSELISPLCITVGIGEGVVARQEILKTTSRNKISRPIVSVGIEILRRNLCTVINGLGRQLSKRIVDIDITACAVVDLGDIADAIVGILNIAPIFTRTRGIGEAVWQIGGACAVGHIPDLSVIGTAGLIVIGLARHFAEGIIIEGGRATISIGRVSILGVLLLFILQVASSAPKRLMLPSHHHTQNM